MTEQEIRARVQQMKDANIPREQIEEWVRTVLRELEEQRQKTDSTWQNIGTPARESVLNQNVNVVEKEEEEAEISTGPGSNEPIKNIAGFNLAREYFKEGIINQDTGKPWTTEEAKEDVKRRRQLKPSKDYGLTTQTFATDEGSIDIKTVDKKSLKPVDEERTSIRPIGDAELAMEEEEAETFYNNTYGSLGFTFTQGLGGDRINVKHENDPGGGVTISHDQWTTLGNPALKEKFNNYLNQYAPNPSQEQIDKTWRLPTTVDNVISKSNKKLTNDEKNKINEKAKNAIDSKGNQQKLADWLEKQSKIWRSIPSVGGTQIANKTISKMFDIASGVFDQKGEATSKAMEYFADKTNPKSPNYDERFAQNWPLMSKEMQQKAIRDRALMEKKKELTKNELKKGVNEYLENLPGIWGSEEKDYAEARAKERETELTANYKENMANFQKVRILNESYNQEVLDYNSLAKDVLKNLESGQAEQELKSYATALMAHYQQMVDNGEISAEEANSKYKAEVQERINILESDAKGKLSMLTQAGTALEEKKNLINELREDYKKEFKELEDISVARDYLDNINSGTLNLLATLGTSTEDLAGSFIHLSGSLQKGGLDLIARGISQLDSVDKENVKNHPYYQMFDKMTDGQIYLGDYLKKTSAEHKEHLKDLPKGWNNVAEKMLIGVAENAPHLALAAYTGGGSIAANMAVFGISGTGDKHYEMLKEVERGEREYTTTQMILAPLAHGAFESITMIPEIYMMRGALKNTNKFGGQKIDVANNPTFWGSVGAKVLGYGGTLGRGIGMELPQETVTQIGQNWTRKYLQGEEGVHLSDGLDADFFIKVVGSTGVYSTAPTAVQGSLLLANGMYLESEQVQMMKNSDNLVDITSSIHYIEKQLEKLNPNDPNFKKLTSQKQDLETKLKDANLESETLIGKILNRFGAMSTNSVNKLREFSKQQSKIRIEANKIKADNDTYTTTEKREKLEKLQDQFNAIEDQKAKIINNKNKYKLEHGNRIRDLEKKALQNLKDKNKGKEPTQEQIEKEAERIFDEGNYDSDARVDEAKIAVNDNIKKFEAQAVIDKINKIDPSLPVEQFEASTLEEAIEWLTQNLKEKGLSETEINEQLEQLTEKSWSAKIGEGASAYIFTPKAKNKDGKYVADPKTHEFDKHQISIINTERQKAGGNWTARGHEILHAIVFKAFKASGKAFKPMAEAMLDRLEQTDIMGHEWLMGTVNDRIKTGKVLTSEVAGGGGRMVAYMDDNGNPTDAYYEEVVMAIADGMRLGTIKRTPAIISRIRKGLKRGSDQAGISKDNQDLMINDAQDMLDILADYGTSLKKGEVSKGVESLLKGKFKISQDLDVAQQKKDNEAMRAKASMDILSKPAREALNAATDAARAVKAGSVNQAYQDHIDGKIDSFTALNRIGEAYEPMVNRAIKHFENENNITFDEFERDTFKFEFLHSSRGVKGSLFRDPNKPKKVIYTPAEGRTPARYLNGLLPQRMIEFSIAAIPDLDAKYATDVTALKDMEAAETAEMTIDQEVEAKRDKRDLKDVDVINDKVISKIKNGISSIIKRGLADPLLSAEQILDNITSTIEKEYSKIIQKQMGEINSEGDRVIPSEEYKTFHDTNFETIVKGLPIVTIKKKYSKLFNITKLAREDDKKVDPITGKVTYPGKGIFEIKAIPKAKFGSYFLNGKLTTLRARQKALAAEIARSLAEDVTYEIAKDPEVIAKIQDMQQLQGFSSMVGIENEIREIANQLDKKKTERASLDVVKLSKDIANLSEIERKKFFDGLKDLGGAYAKFGNYEDAFNEVYGKDAFGKYRQSIIDDMTEYMRIYDKAKTAYDVAEKVIPKTFEDFVTEEIEILNDTKTFRNMLGLSRGSLDFQDLDQLDNVRKAIREIAKDKDISIDEIIRFLPFLYGTGRIGGTSAVQSKYGLERRDADYWFDKIDKENKKETPNEAKIQKWKKAIEEGKEPVKHPYGIFESQADFQDFVLKGLKGYEKGYKSKIPPNAAQNVGIVNKDFNYEDNLASAKRNKKFLKKLADVMIKLEKKGIITKNDIGMVQMSLGNGGMKTPLATAAQVQYMTNDGKKTSGTHIYEHLVPRRVINMAMVSYIAGTVNENQFTKLLDDFAVAIIPRKQADIVDQYYKDSMPADWILGKDILNRYFNIKTFGDINIPLTDFSTGKINAKSQAFADAASLLKNQVKQSKDLSKAIEQSRTIKEPRGITVLDFDDTLATSKSKVISTSPDGIVRKLTAEEFAKEGADLLEQGWKHDFSEFNKVVDGKIASLFNKAMKLQGKFGPENMFVLTARPQESAQSIYDFLKANGLNIPLKNITGLANSTPEAKALWIAEKVGEGYNDFYFADDALQNVQAVKNMLDQFDVKSKVQQAKVKFSKDMSDDFNNILEEVTGIDAEKRFSDVKARKRGASKGKFRFFIPPSHEDFVGLLYNFMGKGRKGDQHRDFFEQALVRPLNRAYREIDTAKQAIANDYKSLNKQFPDVKKKLTKATPDGDFNFQDAIRVYLWNKHGYTIPGLSATDQTKLSELVMNDPNLQAYAETLNIISKQEAYVDPGPNWETGNIRIDLVDATGRVGRAGYFAEFNENADLIFSQENLNKIEAAYGKNVREALEDMLHRIKTGVNRPKGASATPNMFMNWLNASVSGVMFFNTRSALLQQMSNVNFLNFADNNIYAAAKAFANQPQYWKDFAMIFNSDMLKQRRGGLQTDINGAEMAEAIKKARPGNLFDQVAIITGKALKLGFLPTQIGDNIAIATGGAPFYRNRVNKYIKDGLSKKEAEDKAFVDLQDITNATQQSARPDMTSAQQAAWVGKLILNFLNTPSQYNRIIKKAGSDIKNRRITPPNTNQMQSDMSNMSRILYYGAAQNLIFYGLQTALFAVMFGLEDDDEEKRAEQVLKKKERVINGAIDTILRGSGIYGVAVSTIKNMIIKFLEQREKKYNKDESAVLMEALNFSPVVGIRARSIVNAEKTVNYSKDIIKEMSTFDIDNPMWSVVTNYVQVAGFPANRMYQKTINLRNAADNQYTTFQRAMFFSGYTTWSLNLGDTQKMRKIKETVKEKKKAASREKAKKKREEKKKEKIKKMTPTEKLFNLTKKQQVDSLFNLGLTKSEIRRLQYEKDRVNKILQMGGKRVKREKKYGSF